MAHYGRDIGFANNQRQSYVVFQYAWCKSWLRRKVEQSKNWCLEWCWEHPWESFDCTTCCPSKRIPYRQPWSNEQLNSSSHTPAQELTIMEYDLILGGGLVVIEKVNILTGWTAMYRPMDNILANFRETDIVEPGVQDSQWCYQTHDW